METSRGDPGPKTLRHKTLSAYYDKLIKLGEYLGAVVPDELVYHSDRKRTTRSCKTSSARRSRTTMVTGQLAAQQTARSRRRWTVSSAS
jgi:hypothetical protein